MAKTKTTAEPSAEAVAARQQRPERSELPSLRALGQDQAVLDQWLAETEGEETPEIAELWDRLQGDKIEKVKRWGLYLIDRAAKLALMQADVAFYDNEAKRLKARAVAYEADTERSREQLHFQMETQGIGDVHEIGVTVAIQKNPHSLVGELAVADLEAMYLDEAKRVFVRYIPEGYELDRKAALDIWKAASPENQPAVLPPGLSVVQKTRLVVK